MPKYFINQKDKAMLKKQFGDYEKHKQAVQKMACEILGLRKDVKTAEENFDKAIHENGRLRDQCNGLRSENIKIDEYVQSLYLENSSLKFDYDRRGSYLSAMNKSICACRKKHKELKAELDAWKECAHKISVLWSDRFNQKEQIISEAMTVRSPIIDPTTGKIILIVNVIGILVLVCLSTLQGGM